MPFSLQGRGTAVPKYPAAEGGHAHILDPETQVSGVFLVSVQLLQLSGAALQQGQHLGLVPSSLEGGLGPLDVPKAT